jgi:hypothetical protein
MGSARKATALTAMPTKRQRQNIKRVHDAMARSKKLNELRREKEHWIPTSVLKALQDMGLPKDLAEYNARLKELLT